MNKPLDLSNTKVYSNTKGDAIRALSLIGQDVWQDVYMSDYEDFSTYSEGKLVGVSYIRDSDYTTYPFICEICGIERSAPYKHFILKKDAKFKEEKKLRPFKTIEEFEDTTDFKVGDVITIKRFDAEQEYKEVCVFSGYRIVTTETPQIITVYFGNNRYRFDELKTHFNYNVDGEWLPFGVEE